MNTLLAITLTIAVPVYALLWHNQPARAQKEKATAIEAAFCSLFDLSWLKRTAALVADLVASNIPTKWHIAKIHVQSRTKI
jgi:hypothetical protein